MFDMFASWRYFFLNAPQNRKMSAPRYLAPWKSSAEKPALYHVYNRIIEKKFRLQGEDEREKFRTLMRMYERFSGCRVLSYCIMSNHFHILLEVPPMPENGLSDEEFAWRLGALYKPGRVKEIMTQLAEFRKCDSPEPAKQLIESYTYRMHDLSEFMKGLMTRFTMWFNRRHDRKGTLWEQRFKSVIVEGGTAARVMAAYIDLNPVRAGIVEDPAEYRFSSYGEAVGAGARGAGKKSREGLVRAMLLADGVGFDAKRWSKVSTLYREWMGMALDRKAGRYGVDASGQPTAQRKKQNEKVKNRKVGENPGQQSLVVELSQAQMLRHRVRYFTDGAVIGSRAFVNEVFEASRERFGPKRKNGARKFKGSGAAAAGHLWSMRELTK